MSKCKLDLCENEIPSHRIKYCSVGCQENARYIYNTEWRVKNRNKTAKRYKLKTL